MITLLVFVVSLTGQFRVFEGYDNFIFQIILQYEFAYPYY